MRRYPYLPEALYQLLESGSWSGTPAELHAALEPHRAEPWPANPQALGMWLKYHALHFGIEVEHHHTGEHRLLRLGRASNNLAPSGEAEGNDAYRNSFCFASWPALEQALHRLALHQGEVYTLIVQAREDLRLAWPCEAGSLPQVVRDLAARYPSPLRLWLAPGAHSLTEWSPLEA